MNGLGLSRIAEIEHRSDDPDGDRFLPTLAAWFSSPYLGLPPAPTAALAAARTTTDTGAAPPSRVVPPGSAARIRALAGPDHAGGPPTSLVDRHLEGRFGSVRVADLRAVAATVRADRPASVVLRFDDGTEAATTPSTLVTVLVTQILAGRCPAAVADGLIRELRRFSPGPGPVRRTGVATLLPFPVGRAERTAVVGAAAVAVGVGGYPAVGGLLPEAAGAMAPVVGSTAGFLTADPASGTLAATGPLDHLAFRLAPFRRAPVRATVAGGRRVVARSLRRAKRLTRNRATAGVLGLVGIDSDTRLGLVTRLDPPLTTNPWLNPAEWQLLDPEPGYAVVRVEPVR
jgi:hypothetical protein